MKKSLHDKKTYNRIFIDGMNLCAIEHFSKQFLTFNGFPTGMLFGVTQRIRHFQSQFADTPIVFIWEGFNSIRNSKYPHYNSNRRSSLDDAFQTALHDIKRLLPLIGVHQVYQVGLEADDLAGYFSFLYSMKRKNTLLVSNDLDWYQYITDYTDIFKQGFILTKQELQIELGYDPKNIYIYKVLKGDKSDAIPGIFKFPVAEAVRLAKVCNSINDIKKYVHSKYKKQVTESWDSVVVPNNDLIAYHPEWLDPKKFVLLKPKKDPGLLQALLDERGIKSIH